MARIRTIKPEFHSHEELSSLPPETHLLAAALVNYADDEGYFNANPLLVKAGTNPLREDPTPVLEMLHQLAKIDYIEIRQRGNRCFARIVTFGEHQRVSNPTKSKIRDKFEELPKSSVGNRELFRPEGKGKEGNMEQGREEEQEPPPIPEQTRPTPIAAPTGIPTEIQFVAQRIVCAYPKNLGKDLAFAEVSPAHVALVLAAAARETARAPTLSKADALEAILAQVEQHAVNIPAEDRQFLPKIEKYFAESEYRRDATEFITRTGGSHGNNTKGSSNVAALQRSIQARQDRTGAYEDGYPPGSDDRRSTARRLLAGS